MRAPTTSIMDDASVSALHAVWAVLLHQLLPQTDSAKDCTLSQYGSPTATLCALLLKQRPHSCHTCKTL